MNRCKFMRVFGGRQIQCHYPAKKDGYCLTHHNVITRRENTMNRTPSDECNKEKGHGDEERFTLAEVFKLLTKKKFAQWYNDAEFDAWRPEVGVVGILFWLHEPFFPFLKGCQTAVELFVRSADDRGDFCGAVPTVARL